jgi:hypothetical protein
MTSKYKVTVLKTVPPPIRSTPSKYPWATMTEVPSQFVVPNEDAPKAKTLAHCAANYSKRHQKGRWKFAVRTVPEGVLVVRVK